MGAPLLDSPRQVRLTETAHGLLCRLNQNRAHLIFLPAHGHFYFGLGMAIVDSVRQVTVDALVRPGLIVRDKATTLPTYRISSKGQRFLALLTVPSQPHG